MNSNFKSDQQGFWGFGDDRVHDTHRRGGAELIGGGRYDGWKRSQQRH